MNDKQVECVCIWLPECMVSLCPGHIMLQNGLQFQLLTEPNIDPQCTLTCSTTGGPPTIVSWTSDSRTVLYDNSFVFSQTVTNFVAPTYTNTLTITGRYPGQYTLTAHNRNTDIYTVSFPVTSTFQVTGKTTVFVCTWKLWIHASMHDFE